MAGFGLGLVSHVSAAVAPFYILAVPKDQSDCTPPELTELTSMHTQCKNMTFLQNFYRNIANSFDFDKKSVLIIVHTPNYMRNGPNLMYLMRSAMNTQNATHTMLHLPAD